jgi:hypothetical protein
MNQTIVWDATWPPTAPTLSAEDQARAERFHTWGVTR